MSCTTPNFQIDCFWGHGVTLTGDTGSLGDCVYIVEMMYVQEQSQPPLAVQCLALSETNVHFWTFRPNTIPKDPCGT